MKKPRTVTRTIDQDGNEIVRVPLANHPLPAIMDADDYDRLMAADLSNAWTLNEVGHGLAYVRAGHSRAIGQLVTIARLIVDAGAGVMVRYRDKDRLNLRRDNLRVVTCGHAKRESVLSGDGSCERPLHVWKRGGCTGGRVKEIASSTAK